MMKPIIVQKYGGTSLATTDLIKKVAQRIVRKKEAGYNVVVVVSAMGKTTDELERMASEVNETPPLREMDMLYTIGEQQSMALLAMAIEALGHPAISLTGVQLGIITSENHTRAIIQEIKTERILHHLNEGKIVVVAGFQGVSRNGEITTLGRGGSDTTAKALASVLKAEVCEILTDVEGIYTADPKYVENSRKLDVIFTEEMLEMASSGAKILHSRSVELAEKYDIPVIVAHAHRDVPGTIVKKEDKHMESVLVRGITINESEAKINLHQVPDRPGVAAEVFGILDKSLVNVDMIVQTASTENTTDISFTVSRDDMATAVAVMKKLKKTISYGGLTWDDNIVKVSVIGVGMRTKPGVAATVFRTLAAENINIQMISTSEIKISCVVVKKYGKAAVQSLHKAFQLDKA